MSTTSRGSSTKSPSISDIRRGVALSGKILVHKKLEALRSGNADGSSANDVQRTESELTKWQALVDFSDNESDHAVLVKVLSEESQGLHSKLLTEYQADFGAAIGKYIWQGLAAKSARQSSSRNTKEN